jgi:hypothetical protein
MDPISIAIEIELGALLLAVVGGVATWMNHRHQKAVRRQRERHHREVTQLQRQQHREHLAIVRATTKVAEEAIDVCRDEEPCPPARTRVKSRAANR